MIEISSRRLLPALFLLFLPAAAAAQRPVLVLGDGEREIDRLMVGDDLRAELEGEAPDGTYEIHLKMASGEPIAAVPFDPRSGGGVDGDGPGGEAGSGEASGGQTARPRGVLLWPSTGIVGCDCGRGNPEGLWFSSQEQAEEALSGRALQVDAFDGQGVLVASAQLPVEAPPERIYFSDALGCSRRVYATGEQIWVSLLRPAPVASRQLVLSANSTDTSTDVRGAAQALVVPAQSGRKTVAVEMTGLAGSGPFYGFVDAAADGLPGGNLQPVQIGPTTWQRVRVNKGTEHPNGGIVITLDGCLPTPP